MPLAFGGIALGVLIGYPLGGAVYQAMGKSAPFLLLSLFILISIGKNAHLFKPYKSTSTKPFGNLFSKSLCSPSYMLPVGYF